MVAAREYELVLMLDPGREEPAREALAQEARGQIEAAGTLKHENSWGLRKMAYEIDKRNDADYRWFRFEAPTELLESLDHNLKIADGVLRFRIFKVDPDAPVIAPPAVAAPGPAPPREQAAQSAAPEAAPEAADEPADSAPEVAPEAADEPADSADEPADSAPEVAPEAADEPADSAE
ncbi:MAG: 30S ribosomal protein S6 [Solirubrobacterales bacterium]|nr:30S ribosomal protein S6 [Solirubrobacterales bacterium]